MSVLSIMILTRNRKNECLRALRSCVECKLPDKTQFVIVDNASIDGTREAVEQFFINHVYQYDYCYLPENIGVAAGRNEGLRWSKGRYVYFMDDDAYIDTPKDLFFEKIIGYLQERKQVFCITTSIFDLAINDVRPVIRSRRSDDDEYHKVLMFHGGSCLIDKQKLFDQKRLFLEQQLWGMEELYPSIKSYVDNQCIVEMNDVKIIHEPSMSTRFDRQKYVLFICVGAAHVKLTLYPLVTYPVIYLLFYLRVVKHLGIKSVYRASRQLSQINRNLTRETVPISKLINLITDFGFVAIF